MNITLKVFATYFYKHVSFGMCNRSDVSMCICHAYGKVMCDCEPYLKFYLPPQFYRPVLTSGYKDNGKSTKELK